ncbi:MAG TPA: FlgD immunoglobulin-like domain containing protein, partial [Candidatus Eisenbacteria bacterium]
DVGPPDGVSLLRDPRHDRLVAVRNQPGKPIDTWFLSFTRSPVDPDAAARGTVWRIGPARVTAAGDGIEIPFQLTAATRVIGAVHDLEGKLVRRLDEAKLPAGSWTFVWDGRDESGVSVPPGPYDVMLTRLDTGAVGKLRVAREE